MTSPSSSTGTVRAGYLLLLLQTLEHNGLDPRAIYAPELLVELGRLDPHAHRPVEEWDRMVVAAERHAGGLDIALKMAEFVKPWDTGPVGFITMASRTLREAILALQQFYSLLNDVYRMHCEMADDGFVVELIPQGPLTSARLERLTLATIVWHARWLSRRPDLAFDVSFTFERPEPAQVLACQRIFGGTVTFNAGRTCLQGPGEYADHGVARSPHSEVVQDLLRKQLMAEMAVLHESQGSFLQRVERVVRDRLEQGQVRLEDVAVALDVSSRTLQSRLEESHLSYRVLLDRQRHALALEHVADPRTSLLQVAQMLGFATQSAFQRAFKRWTGQTPGEYRRAASAELSPPG